MAIMMGGLAGWVLGFGLFGFVGASTSRSVLVGFQLILGFGIGMVMPSVLVCVQNAAERRDVGAATGCLLLLRSMGGAFGSTLVGALLAGGFAARLGEIGISARVNLGAMRQGSLGIPGVGPAMLPHVQAALTGAFHVAFMACAVAMVGAMIVTRGMNDLPLRTTAANEPPEPAVLAH